MNHSTRVIPEAIATCPECGAKLICDISEWIHSSCDSFDSRLIDLGLSVQCSAEDLENRDTWHRCWQAEWQPVITKVERWLKAVQH